jgi:beta-N-acetylglucosaminidase
VSDVSLSVQNELLVEAVNRYYVNPQLPGGTSYATDVRWDSGGVADPRP